MQTLVGGSQGSGNSQGTNSSGFGALPPEIQNQISSLATSAGNLLNPGGTANSSLFTLPSLNSGASNALGELSNQTNDTATPASIAADQAAQMNPFNSSVIGQIEQAQNGNMSQLTNYLSDANAFGANRGDLGANDIAMQQANQIGGFEQSEYNTALNNSVNMIPAQNLAAQTGAVQAGQTQQNMELQNQQAPVSALSSLAQIINTGVPATSTGQSTSSNESSSYNHGLLETVLCTALYKQGLVSRKLWMATQRYGQQSDPATFAGYLMWATPIAKMVSKYKWFAKLMAIIFIPPLRKEAAIMGMDIKCSVYGNIAFQALFALSVVVGHIIKLQKRNKSWI